MLEFGCLQNKKVNTDLKSECGLFKPAPLPPTKVIVAIPVVV